MPDFVKCVPTRRAIPGTVMDFSGAVSLPEKGNALAAMLSEYLGTVSKSDMALLSRFGQVGASAEEGAAFMSRIIELISPPGFSPRKNADRMWFEPSDASVDLMYRVEGDLGVMRALARDGSPVLADAALAVEAEAMMSACLRCRTLLFRMGAHCSSFGSVIMYEGAYIIMAFLPPPHACPLPPREGIAALRRNFCEYTLDVSSAIARTGVAGVLIDGIEEARWWSS